MVERPLCMRKAQGSNPCSSSLQNNSVAQWIAYQTSNLGVAGSSPVGVVRPSIFVAQRIAHQTSNLGVAGSNPAEDGHLENLKLTGSTPVSVSPRFGLIVWPSG